VARLADGQQVEVEVLRRVAVSAAEPLWLVREWREKDVDTKVVSAVQGEPGRFVAALRPEDITEAVRPLWVNYPVGLRRMDFWKALGNTLLVCLMGVVGVTVSSVLVAYALAFVNFRGRKLLFLLTLATMMIPFPATMVPMFAVFRWLGWVGTFKPLWVPAWFGSAFFIFLLRQFFMGIPKDLLDSARLAGAGELQILWHVVLPLSRPALAMVALFHFLYCWKDFMGPLLYLNDKSRQTLSLALQNFHAEQGGTPWHLMMAASVVFSLPLIVLFFLTVKTFVRSVTMTGLKG
jgi:multiple sugar transport system permease protein